MSAFQPWERYKPRPKDEKGATLKARKRVRKDEKNFENAEKRKVREDDKRCRWPFCENCRVFKPRLEVAHIAAKGMGGDHGEKSTEDQMILLDFLTHQSGPDSLEQHGRRIVPLTDQGTRGPCEFWRVGEDGREYLVARERAPFVYERD